MSGKKVTLKLVGARQFACVPAGIVDPIAQGGKVTVTPKVACSLRKLTSRDRRGNIVKMFAEVDDEAELPELPSPKTQTLDEAVASGDAAKGEGRDSPLAEPEPELSELEQRADEEAEVAKEDEVESDKEDEVEPGKEEVAKEPASFAKAGEEAGKRARKRGEKQ